MILVLSEHSGPALKLQYLPSAILHSAVNRHRIERNASDADTQAKLFRAAMSLNDVTRQFQQIAGGIVRALLSEFGENTPKLIRPSHVLLRKGKPLM